MLDKDNSNIIIDLKNICKSFIENDNKVDILKDLNLQVNRGDKVAIVGPSGSGKSTLLSIISSLDKVDSGQVFIKGKDLSNLSEKELAKYRNADIGMIFQSFELILPFNVIENVSTPQDISGVKNKSYILELLDKVDLLNKKNRNITNLSGGEKQRVAIARSLANDPDIILADEPTGSLDRISGQKVLDILLNLVENKKKTLIIITHDEQIANYMDKIYEIRDSQLYRIK